MNLGVLGEVAKGRACCEQPEFNYGKARVLVVGFLHYQIEHLLVYSMLEYEERLWRKNRQSNKTTHVGKLLTSEGWALRTCLESRKPKGLKKLSVRWIISSGIESD